MKKVLLVVTIALFTHFAQAQFSKARLQATGLTCAMCSNAINKALQRVPFVESVQPDIKNSAFNIVFRKDAEVDIDALKSAVQDAGFSIGGLKLTGTFNEIKISDDQPVKLGKGNFCFLDLGNQVLNGEQTIRVLEKDFLTAKEFKKLSVAERKVCQPTGMAQGQRIYHVTI